MARGAASRLFDRSTRSHSSTWICAGLMSMAGLTQAEALTVRGSVGPLQDWALQMSLEPSGGATPQRYSGPLNLRHTGICTAKDHGTKTGAAEATLKGNDLYRLTMTFNGETCSLAGPVPVKATATRDFMRCDQGQQVLIRIWSDEPNPDQKPPHS